MLFIRRSKLRSLPNLCCLLVLQRHERGLGRLYQRTLHRSYPWLTFPYCIVSTTVFRLVDFNIHTYLLFHAYSSPPVCTFSSQSTNFRLFKLKDNRYKTSSISNRTSLFPMIVVQNHGRSRRGSSQLKKSSPLKDQTFSWRMNLCCTIPVASSTLV